MSPSEMKTTTSKERVRNISGFPEWLPEYRLVELQWIDLFRKVFESYGFTSIEPRSIEPVEVLLKQGDTDKEIYSIGGAQAVAALAYGTKKIVKVNKIVGPGNLYVTTAKKEIFGGLKQSEKDLLNEIISARYV